jgi:uncharacterized protein YndB with AHSA1/START domain
MNEFEIVTVIERPAADVFAALTDLAKIPVWTPALSEVRTVDGGPVAVGSLMVFVGTFLGRSFETTAECTVFEPDTRFASIPLSGPFHVDVDYRLEPGDGATTLNAHYRADSQGFFKLAEPVILRLARRHFESANENLKALLEGDAM